ncbi:MAG: prepilin-type N-terminal cleavage/methylation domain-containing protein [Candidatus Wolfebacteria bacterium]|nr:prepilin-type N-terminal cleavage/methylation domain-containing protein [Candidatus Wolfebacteria bacterium]
MKSFSNFKNRGCNTGFTLIEALVASTLLLIISSSIYLTYANILEIILKNQWRAEAVAAIETEFETARKMNYSDIGILGGYPVGKLLATTTVQSGGGSFLLTTTVRNVDDPFDGTLGGTPNDTSPADYKIIEVEANCISCAGFGGVASITMTTTVAPAKGLETTTNNGSLFINVLDAYGQPISGANVNVTNSSTTPPINITDTTNLNGVLQLVDIPTSTASYRIPVSKSGYSSERTYPAGAPSNPNPTKPDATVASQQVTSISFTIDRLSVINLSTQDKFCSPVPNSAFSIQGGKLIGTNPDILKYSANSQTDASGNKILNNLEWDTYGFTNSNTSYDLSGNLPLLPLTLNPSTTTNLKWLMEPKLPLALLATVKDQNNQPIDDVSVKITGNLIDKTQITGQRSFIQTDWSGSNYFSQSGDIETEAIPGTITLKSSNGTYTTSTQWLESNTFNLGASNVSFYSIDWLPASQPSQTGIDSLKFQLAANNDNSTWNYVGPDGTSNSFYTSSSTISSLLNNNRYFRYKVFLNTVNPAYTPSLQEIEFYFSSSCIPLGQTLFNGLTNQTYTVTASKTGYQNYTNSAVSIFNDWQEFVINLLPL